MITKKLSKYSIAKLNWLLIIIVMAGIFSAVCFTHSHYWWAVAIVTPVTVAAAQTVMSALYTKGLRNGAGAREL